MTKLVCPRCGTTPFAAFFRARFKCPKCGVHLTSDLRTVSVIASVVMVGPFYLGVATIAAWLPVSEWSTAYAALIMLVPAGVIDWAVLRRYLTITEEPQP